MMKQASIRYHDLFEMELVGKIKLVMGRDLCSLVGTSLAIKRELRSISVIVESRYEQPNFITSVSPSGP